jgi:predicted amidophosphoribosyltransferase
MWLAARDAYINHVMICRQCVTHIQRLPRLCPDGQRLQDSYNEGPCTTGKN